jgi:hypothetical protein
MIAKGMSKTNGIPPISAHRNQQVTRGPQAERPKNKTRERRKHKFN